MGTIDLVIIGITALLVLIGLAKGLVKQVLSTANWLVAILGSFFLVKPASGLLRGSLGITFNEKIYSWVSTKGDIFSTEIGSLQDGGFSQGLEALGLPKFIADIFVNLFKTDSLNPELTLGQALSNGLGSIALTIIVFVILFIVLLIILKILTGMFNKVASIGVIGVINRLLGAVLGLVKALVLVSVAMLLASAISGIIPSVQQFLTTDLKLGTEAFGIGKYFYENNPILSLINGSFNFDEILKEFGVIKSN